MDLIEQIKQDEGFRQFVYQCTASRWTIGYGRNVDERGGKGISEGEAAALLRKDVAACTSDLFKLFGARTWGGMGAVRQNALVNMCVCSLIRCSFVPSCTEWPGAGSTPPPACFVQR